MGMDDRIVHLVRREVDRVLAEADPGAAADDLHTELHALATKVDELARRVGVLESAVTSAPRASRPRKAAGRPVEDPA